MLISEINYIHANERLFFSFSFLQSFWITIYTMTNYLWTYFEWLFSFAEELIEMDRAKCIFRCNRFNSCFPNEVIMLIMLKSSMMKRKTSQFQAPLPLTDTTLCNSPDNIINDYKWNEYFVTVKCSAYKSHKRGFKQDAKTHRQCRCEINDSGRMKGCDWGFLCITDKFRAFSMPMPALSIKSWNRIQAIEPSCWTIWPKTQRWRKVWTLI